MHFFCAVTSTIQCSEENIVCRPEMKSREKTSRKIYSRSRLATEKIVSSRVTLSASSEKMICDDADE